MDSQIIPMLFFALLIALPIRAVVRSRRRKRAAWRTLRGPVDAPTDGWRGRSSEFEGEDSFGDEEAGWSGEEQFADRRARGEIEVVGLDAYYARTGLRRPVRDESFRPGVGLNGLDTNLDRTVADREIRRGSRLAGSGVGLDDLDIDLDRPDVGLDDLDIDLEDTDYDGDSWGREDAVMRAQSSLRIMREEDQNYALDAIEANVLNLDHEPDEEELAAIADSAADAYDMSEDYRDY